MNYMNVESIRNEFIRQYHDGEFVTDKTGVKTLEILGATFVADEPWIVSKPNEDYIEREIAWYESQSLFVKDIPGKTPKIWEDVASSNGEINSNYGWAIYSPDNFNQYESVKAELIRNINSRRAVMIYNRPSMQIDYNRDGMSDFMCTFANSFHIRDNKLHSHFIMRSTDAVFGYNNDYAWAKHVQKRLLTDLNEEFSDSLEIGNLIWTSSSFHVYERHFGKVLGLSGPKI